MARPSKQEQIVRAARELFVEYGYQAASIDLVVQRAGVSKPTVYNHFPTKQSMLEEILGDLIEECREMVSGIGGNMDHGSIAGLVDLYQALAGNPGLLAAYRIRIGESHKLESLALQRFEQIEALIDDWAQNWLAGQQNALQVRSVCRDQILFPALTGGSQMPRSQIISLLEQM